MILYLITNIFWILCLAIVLYALPVIDEKDAAVYLKNFGYLEESAGQEISPLRAQEAVSAAIKDFQRFANLNETGELDNETMAMMNVPRCGVKDKISDSDKMNRYKLQGSKWGTNELTYGISKYSSKFRDYRIVKKEIVRAFKVWSDVTPLKFSERWWWWQPVNIDIRFEVGYHGDGTTFDGPGGELAHAFFPQYGGNVHFDDEEKWTINKKRGINLFQVAAHEFGHSLGLEHSRYKTALMAPFYREYVPRFQLHFDDIQGIQALYGPRYRPRPPDYEDFGYIGAPPDATNSEDMDSPPDRVNSEDVGPPPDTSDAPDLCQDSKLDTVTRTKSGSTYVFKGYFYWEVLSSGIAEGYPRRISDDWDGLPGNLNASVTWSYGRTYFFKGKHYWRFTNKRMDSGYPKLISVGFQGIPDNLDAAFVWSRNGKTYFFRGNQHWQYDSSRDPPVSTIYPQPAGEWSSLLADGIDAAFQWENRRTYFFKGNQYYRYNDIASEVDEVDSSYRRSTAKEWFGCS